MRGSFGVVRLVSGVVAAGLVLSGSFAAGAPGGEPSAGSAGAGDPYYPIYGNGGYDVEHYDIDLDVSPKTSRVEGRTVVRATATQALSRFNLDFVLPVRDVRVDGAEAAFSQNRHELVVRPRTPIEDRASFRVVVRYTGVPSGVDDGDIDNPVRPSTTGFALFGEPESAAWWFPSNDHPSDKATYDIALTVPRSVEALSIGRLVSRRARGETRTWRWRENDLTASYLSYFAVGQYRLTERRTPFGPLVNAIERGSGKAGSRAMKDLGRAPEIVSWLSDRWGPYPFDDLGGVMADTEETFALETQARPIYSPDFWRYGQSPWIVVHELAHQWAGNSVSVRNWRDIWLNEGFATYAEWLWDAEQYDESPNVYLGGIFRYTPRGDPFWSVKIGDPGVRREFNGAVYQRGAMTLQALSNRIGPRVFQRVMRTWLRVKRDENATVREFISLAEGISGDDLTSFFDAWLFSSSRPKATKSNGLPPWVVRELAPSMGDDQRERIGQMMANAEALSEQEHSH